MIRNFFSLLLTAIFVLQSLFLNQQIVYAEDTSLTETSEVNEPQAVPVIEQSPIIESVSESSDTELIKKEDPYKDLPKSGVLSGSYSFGGDTKAVAGPWGAAESKKAAGGNLESPISGSVSRISAKQWKASVFNNSPDDFSISVKVRQLDSRGNAIKTDNFSFRLKAGSKEERLITSASSTINAELDLVSWKKL